MHNRDTTISWYGKSAWQIYSPDLAEKSKPLRELLKGKNFWNWGPDQELTSFYRYQARNDIFAYFSTV